VSDLSEVETVLVSTVTQAIYPDGTAAASAVGNPCRIYRGWPVPGSLDADLKAGVVNISVFSLDQEQNVTRYTTDWLEIPSPPVRLTLTVAGNNVTVAGTPSSPLNAAVLVNQKAYVYPLQATDTPTSIATALAALINADTPATSLGPVITVTTFRTLQTRIGAVGTVVQEVKRQKKFFRITLWCNSPALRDAVAAVVDPALSSLTFLSLPDGTGGRIRYERTHPDDMAQKVLLYRRDLVYSVEYGTTNTQKAAEVVSEIITVSGGLDPTSPPVETINV
jgi:hypothetical protein